MKETWRAGIDWDEKVPDAIEQKMKKLFPELKILDHIKVDRQVQENKEYTETNISIHSYSDTSEEAYGAAVYLAIQNQNGDASSKLVDDASAPGKWNHVKTKENPADSLSQGMSIAY